MRSMHHSIPDGPTTPPITRVEWVSSDRQSVIDLTGDGWHESLSDDQIKKMALEELLERCNGSENDIDSIERGEIRVTRGGVGMAARMHRETKRYMMGVRAGLRFARDTIRSSDMEEVKKGPLLKQLSERDFVKSRVREADRVL